MLLLFLWRVISGLRYVNLLSNEYTMTMSIVGNGETLHWLLGKTWQLTQRLTEERSNKECREWNVDDRWHHVDEPVRQKRRDTEEHNVVEQVLTMSLHLEQDDQHSIIYHSSGPVTNVTISWESNQRVMILTTLTTPWVRQESHAIAKMTARCALHMDALKNFGSPWLRPHSPWPRDAPYIWMHWKILGVPGYAHIVPGYFSQNC